MENIIFKYISKYALVLSIFYLAENAIQSVVEEFVYAKFDYMTGLWVSTSISFLIVLLNLVTAFMLNRDIKKLNLPTRYVILVTILYRPVGVCAFLLYLLYENTRRRELQ